MAFDVAYVDRNAGTVFFIDLGAGSVPANTSTELYIDITGLVPFPAVGWYYDEKCDVFSSVPFPTPPGSVAPTYPPGGTPTAPTTPVNQGPAPPPVLIPHLIPFHAAGSADSTTARTVTITNIPGIATKVPGSPYWRFDMTRVYEMRGQGHVEVIGPSNSVVRYEYSLNNGVSWAALDTGAGPWMPLYPVGPRFGPKVYLDPTARQAGEVLIRALTEQGDGSTDPQLSNFGLMVWLAVERGTAFPSPPGMLLPAGCGLTKLWPQWEDFARFTTDQEFWDYVYGLAGAYSYLDHVPYHLQFYLGAENPATTGRTFLDFSMPYNAHPTLKGTFNRIYWDAQFSDGNPPGDVTENTAAWEDDFWVRMQIRVPTGFETQTHLVEPTMHAFFEAVFDDFWEFGFDTRTDEVTIWKNWSTGTKTVLGTASTMVVGQGWLDVGLHVVRSGGTVTIKPYCGPACSALAPLGSVSGAQGAFAASDYIGQNQYYYRTVGAAGKELEIGGFEIVPSSVNPNPFGWTP